MSQIAMLKRSASYRSAVYVFAAVIGGILIALCVPTLLANAAHPAQGELSETEREAIKSELLVLQEQLAVLRTNPAVKLDQWADANIFVKGVSSHSFCHLDAKVQSLPLGRDSRPAATLPTCRDRCSHGQRWLDDGE